jgi:hypothetical protein
MTRLLAWFCLIVLSQAALAQQARPGDSDSMDAGLCLVRRRQPRKVFTRRPDRVRGLWHVRAYYSDDVEKTKSALAHGAVA